MEQKLYDLMDWAGIEELTYSESADPHRMLGPHVTEEGLLIQAFIPTATAITVKLTGNGKKYPMELADEAGFYAVLIPRKTVTAYTLLVTYDNGTEEEIHDPYSFGPLFTEEDMDHAEESARYKKEAFGGERPYAVYFSKRVNESVANGDGIQSHSDIVTDLDYEVELAVIIGKEAKNVPGRTAVYGRTDG